MSTMTKRDSRVFLGKGEHWLVLVIFVAALYAMGTRNLHVRAFVSFSLSLFTLVLVALAFIVWRYRPGDRITREALDPAHSPHAGQDPVAPPLQR
jgi:hypothetical protein